eukprot:gene24570-21640_t
MGRHTSSAAGDDAPALRSALWASRRDADAAHAALRGIIGADATDVEQLRMLAAEYGAEVAALRRWNDE